MLSGPLKILNRYVVVLTMIYASLYSALTFAADPAPGTACSVNNSRIRSGGPEASGIVYDMTCQGGVWVATLTYLANSNVGIGTTSPAYKFEVQGSNSSVQSVVVNANSSTAQYPGFKAMNFMGAAAAGYPILDINNNRGTLAAPTAIQSGDWLGQIAFSGAEDSAWNQNQGAAISALAGENYSATASGSALFFSTTPIGSASLSERMRIHSSGNVGIGTTLASSLIHGRISDSSTATVTNVLRLEHETTGTAAAGFGTGLLLTGESSTTSNRDMAQISALWSTATDASRASNLAFSTLTGGGALTERVRIDDFGWVGIGTTYPFSMLHIANGDITVQKSNDTPTSSPEISFNRSRGTPTAPTVLQANDEIGQLWFYGFNGSGHQEGAGIQIETSELWSGTSQGSVMKFLTTNSGATTSSTRMTITQAGDVGIGTASPTARLDVVGGSIRNMRNNDTASNGPLLSLRRSRGTASAPTAVQAGDNIGEIWGAGYDGTGYFNGAGMTVVPIENWTSTAHGANLNFFTVPSGSTTPVSRMTIAGSGNVGIGTTNPQNQLEVVGGGLQISRNNNTANSASALSLYRSRGTSSAPTGVQAGDYIGAIWAYGHDGTSYGFTAAINIDASETWTTTSHGSIMRFSTTASGSTSPTYRMTILPNGNVGIGTTAPSHILEITGQGRSTVSTWATTSDIRLKDIQGDFQYGLDEILKLHTVWFNYKKDNPLNLPSDKKYSGVIAQELKDVIPEAVTKESDGFYSVNSDPIQWSVINAIQEMWNSFVKVFDMNQEQERTIQSLQQENAELKKYLCEKDSSAPFCDGKN